MFAFLKGWFGEKVTALGIAISLDRRIYRRIDDLILTTDRGTTQVDHVILSPFGIFVIETKNMRGWIFGGERDPFWTQVNFRRKDRFQNPLRQNYAHTRAVAEKLGVELETVHSVVFFIGDCQFKTPPPRNVLTRGLSAYIRGFAEFRFSEAEVEQFERRLRDIKTHTLFTRTSHVRGLKERHSSTTACPKCGEPLVERTARRGRNVGGTFLGCSAYPKCRYTRTP